MQVLGLVASIAVATIVGANAADSPIALRWLLPLRRLRCPKMAWLHTRQSRLPLLSSLGQRRLLIITHQSRRRCSGLRRMASDRRASPGGRRAARNVRTGMALRRGCNWQPGCAPPPERYYGASEPPGPQVYPSPDAPPARERYLGPYAPQSYSGPTGPYAGARSTYRE